ncbi:MAG: S-ribosylhomocysteine lyase [Ruminococcaceae bacterium]|nr:S-ribosylhomocysteine lyase [Oscillospiraceae bacterium]
MKQIASFSVDHDKITAGMYISRIDGDITTFDLRTRKPNAGEYMDNITMHSVEHMLATLLRNGEIGDQIIYFGPMGCRTGFYLLTRDLAPLKVLEALKVALEQTIAHKGAVFGATRRECGNYLELDIEAARVECARYLEVLKNHKGDFRYEA